MTSHRCGPSHASAESAGVGYHRAKGCRNTCSRVQCSAKAASSYELGAVRRGPRFSRRSEASLEDLVYICIHVNRLVASGGIMGDRTPPKTPIRPKYISPDLWWTYAPQKFKTGSICKLQGSDLTLYVPILYAYFNGNTPKVDFY